MRIRKRQPPLPRSALSPPPLSDPLLPNLNYSPPPMVQLHHHHDGDDHHPTLATQPKPSNPPHKTLHVGHPRPQPSDHGHPNQGLSPIRGPGKGWGFSDAGNLELMILKGEEDEIQRESKEEEDHKAHDDDDDDDDDIRKETILGAETLLGFASGSTTSSHRGVRGWFEGEKAFPLKKRRGSIGKGGNDEGTRIMDQSRDKELTKNEMERNYKKCDAHQPGNEDVDDDVNVVGGGATRNKRGRGGAIMEGSRCSRVNGRGWRCFQQTLVGYSLCEHHLGKGRLRSMKSVRSRSITVNNTAAGVSSSESRHEEGKKGDDDGENEEIAEKPLRVTKRRMKLGIVKARSMSSLLGQTNTSGVAAVADDGGGGDK